MEQFTDRSQQDASLIYVFTNWFIIINTVQTMPIKQIINHRVVYVVS